MSILLVIIRQTYGWYDKRTKSYKKRDWIAQRFFEEKTNLSIRTISSGIDALVEKGVITLSNEQGHLLISAQQRRMASKIFYSLRRKVLTTRKYTHQNKKELGFMTDKERQIQLMAQKNLHKDPKNQ